MSDCRQIRKSVKFFLPLPLLSSYSKMLEYDWPSRKTGHNRKQNCSKKHQELSRKKLNTLSRNIRGIWRNIGKLHSYKQPLPFLGNVLPMRLSSFDVLCKKNWKRKKWMRAFATKIRKQNMNSIYMVSMAKEPHSVMNFAVDFLKMFPLCMLWRAQFLSDFYSVFCVYQILSCRPL